MSIQPSLFDKYTDNFYWESPVINKFSYTLLDIIYPREKDYCSYFQKYFDANTGLFEKLLSSNEIWIKPNITSGEKWERGKTSNPFVLSALIDFLKKYKLNKNIYVADSSVVGYNTIKAAEECGIFQVCNNKGISFVDIRELNYRKMTVKNSLIYDIMDIAEPFVTPETFKINLAKIKSTYGSPVGFTIKNSKGVIPDELKIQFHKRGVQKAICDLFECINWDLAVLEGLPVSELGKAKDNGSIIISDSTLICDYYEASMLYAIPDYDENYQFHLNILSKRYGVDNESFSTIFRERRLLTDQRLIYCLHGIKQLEEDYFVSIHDGKPCSGCLESFSKAIMGKEQESLKELKTTFVLGSEGDLYGNNNLSLIGTCAIDNLTMSGFKNSNIQDNIEELIKLDNEIKSSFPTSGCPPTIDSINETINKLYDKFGILISRDKYSGYDISFPTVFNSNLPEIYKQLVQIIPRENILFNEFNLELCISCEVICATICHQMNWNYLRTAILEKTIKFPMWTRPEYLSNISTDEVKELFSRYTKQNKMRANERKKLLNNIGVYLKQAKIDYTGIFFNKSTGELKRLEEILEIIIGCTVFSDDPERKKIQILFNSLSEYSELERLVEYSDPAIDYHIIRTYLRRGLVFPLTNFTRNLLFDWNVKSERTIGILRSYCSKAIKRISSVSGIPISRINNIDWWIGRSVCIHGEPDCLLMNKKSHWLKAIFNKCPFYYNCDAVKDYKLMTINEPNYSGRSY